MTNLIFNVIDWHELDESDEKYNKKYYIKCFGRTEDGKSVYLRIDDFPVHFYILIPEDWNSDNINRDKDNITESLIIKNSSLRNSFAKNKDTNKYLNDIVDRKKFYGFSANKKNKFMRLIFTNKNAMYDTSRILENKIYIKNYGNIKFELYENNIDPYLRFLHINDIQSCGWIKINYDKLKLIDEETTCYYNYSVNWIYVEKEKKNMIAPFYICSFDLECKSIDGSFPQACRESDKIIQIGMTFNKYSYSEISKKIMISLKSCDDIIDTEVISVETEEELLLKFQQIIEREDPDILTGYNIFSFDFPYLLDRAKLLNVDNSFYYLSKLKKYKCKLVSKKLSSFALGDNNLNYINSIGRVNIDLMKVVQKDYKLNSYKLDSVAEFFIKEKIIGIDKLKDNKYKIISKNLSVLKINNFIRFEKNNEIIMKKYKIIDIDYNENWFLINIMDDTLNNYTSLLWGLVKDDIKPNDIFELYEKKSSDRKIIAEYCIQDCALVSKLISKLEILTNNINMANVCYVPLHFIFFRGQSIKCFSLVAKYCRLNKILIPNMKKNTIEDDSGFEGATVFDPMIGFHRKPIPVLDYNSLYPSSIISKNISHETFVLLPEYDNLPNYIYYDVSYNNDDGSITKCRFAKLKDENNTKFGIIPTILMGLLNERKITKKEMENETDPFKKSILDGKQAALKITANSIYGQLGSNVSPIYFKEGAACTTAIGREMLELSRDFVEKDFKKILYNLYETKKAKDIKLYREILNINLKEKNDKFESFLETFIIELFDNYEISPKVIYGDSVMPYTPILLKINNEIKIITIEELGNKLNNNWINYDNFKLFDTTLICKQKIELNNFVIYAYTHKGWTRINKLIRHTCNKSIYRINTNIGIVDVTEDHSLISKDGEYLKPEELNMKSELLHSFPLLSKIDIDIDINKKIKTDNQYMAQVYYYYLKKAGMKISIEYISDYYILTCVDEISRDIKKIEKLYNKNEYNGYVYDIETEHGVFQAGIGEIIVKNTDSIFINMDLKDKKTLKDVFDKKTLQFSINLGECASKFLKTLLPYPHNMEYEKTFYPFALLAKKKYIGNKYETDINYKKQTSMGVVLKRRDNANIVKIIVGGMVKIMLDEIDIDKTIIFMKNSIRELLDKKFDINDFITSKSLKSNYKGKKITSEIKMFKDYIKDKPNIIKQDIDDIINSGMFRGLNILIDNTYINRLEFNDEEHKKSFKNNFDKQFEYNDKKLMIDLKNENSNWRWNDVICSQAHIRLAQRMEKRDPGNAPQINDRIPYVMVIPKDTIKKKEKLLQGDKIEHPEFIIDNKLEIDYLFYLTNQIKNPSIQFLDLIMKHGDAEKLFKDFIDIETNKRRDKEESITRNKSLQLFSRFNIIKSNDDELNCNDFIDMMAKPNNTIVPKNKKNK